MSHAASFFFIFLPAFASRAKRWAACAVLIATHGAASTFSTRPRPLKAPVQLHLQTSTAWSSQTPPQQDGAAPGSSSAQPHARWTAQQALPERLRQPRLRRKTEAHAPGLPTARQPATPLPVPGSSRTLRYQPEGAANAQLVRDLQQYGALVVVIGDGDDEPIGCVVDVRLAEVSDEGQAAVVASCTSSNARVSLGRIAKAFPYTAREVSTLEDTDFLYADDVLAAYDVIEEDEPSTSKARNDCVDLLEATLDLCDKLRPTLGAVDAFGTESGEGEYARMAQRLREAVAKDDDEADEERDRRLSFLCLSLLTPRMS